MRYPSLLLFVFLLVLSLPEQAKTAGSSAIVCGVQLDQENALSWARFKDGRGKLSLARSDRLGLLQELRSLLLEESAQWPVEVQLSAITSINHLVEGSGAFSSFALSKTADLPTRQVVFRGTDEELDLPVDQASELCAEEETRAALVAIARFVNLVQRSGAEIDSPAFQAAVQRIKALERDFDKYLYEGFAMFPWEALANSWLLTDKSLANGPPKNQLVLLHPAAGLVGATGSGSDTDLGVALSVEPIGWIHYRDDYESWYGASLITVFPGDRNAGIGVALNYNEFKVGVTWHDYGAADDYGDPTLFVGIELYRFLGKQQRQYQGYMDKVKSLASDR